MKLQYILPGVMSGSQFGTAEIARRTAFLERWVGSETSIAMVEVPTGRATVESACDELLGAAACCDAIRAAESSGVDGVIVGCFGDPGLYALRELTTRTIIVGPGSCSLHWAGVLGDRFGVITPLASTERLVRRLVIQAGLLDSLVGIEVAGTSIMDISLDRARSVQCITACGQRLAEAGADVIVLGCMSMGFQEWSSDLAGILALPVVNPVRAGIHTIEGLISAGMMHSLGGTSASAPREESGEAVTRGRRPSQHLLDSRVQPD